MRILILGAGGYLGGRLVPALLKRGHEIVALVRHPERLAGHAWASQVRWIAGEVPVTASGDPTALRRALIEGGRPDAIAYLMHGMNAPGDFAERDRRAAHHVAREAHAAGVPKLVYLGGLAPDCADASPHLKSRTEVAEILMRAGPCTVLRAGPVIGSGSASFELVRYLTERVPVMLAPRWVDHRVSPIGVRDALAYLVAALEAPPAGVVDIAGDTVSFGEMILGYARARGLTRRIWRVPLLRPWLASHWCGIVTPVPAHLARPLMEGIRHDLVADPAAARRLFPGVHPAAYPEMLARVFARLDRGAPETRWADAAGAWARDTVTDWEGCFTETHGAAIPPGVSAERVLATVARLGGGTGYPSLNWAWRIRGLLDRLVGGPGLRRGRRDADTVRVGDAIDFWRVEDWDPARRLLLRAEMRVPGEATLEFVVTRTAYGAPARLMQIARFIPRGLTGWLYWQSMAPAHAWIFRRTPALLVHAAARGA